MKKLLIFLIALSLSYTGYSQPVITEFKELPGHSEIVKGSGLVATFDVDHIDTSGTLLCTFSTKEGKVSEVSLPLNGYIFPPTVGPAISDTEAYFLFTLGTYKEEIKIYEEDTIIGYGLDKYILYIYEGGGNFRTYDIPSNIGYMFDHSSSGAYITPKTGAGLISTTNKGSVHYFIPITAVSFTLAFNIEGGSDTVTIPEIQNIKEVFEVGLMGSTLDYLEMYAGLNTVYVIGMDGKLIDSHTVEEGSTVDLTDLVSGYYMVSNGYNSKTVFVD